jgi:hypothetical protein
MSTPARTAASRSNGRADPHDVARTFRTGICGAISARVACICRDRLADAETAEGQAVERQRRQLGEVGAAQREVGAALDDAEAQLGRREDLRAQRAWPGGPSGCCARRPTRISAGRRRRRAGSGRGSCRCRSRARPGSAARSPGSCGGASRRSGSDRRPRASSIFCKPRRLNTWKPPLSVRIGRSQADHPVEAAEPGDALRAGSVAKVVAVTEDDLRAHLAQVVGIEALDRAVGADRHEARRVDRAVRGPQPARRARHPRGARTSKVPGRGVGSSAA